MHHESPSLPASAPQLDCDALIFAAGIGVAASLRLALEPIENLEATRRQHGVRSNYRFDLATHTWSSARTVNRLTCTAWNAPRKGREWLAQPGATNALAGR